MKHSLRERLNSSYLIAIALTAVILVILANIIVARQFSRLVADAGERDARRLMPVLAKYYSDNGSWEGIDQVFKRAREADWPKEPKEPLPPEAGPVAGIVFRDDRFVVLDNQNEVVADSHSEEPPLMLSNKDIEKAELIYVDGEAVGKLIFVSRLGKLNPWQRGFLFQVTALILLMGFAAALSVVVVTSWQTKRILAPVLALVEAARQVADGDYSQKVPVETEDELGEMASAFNTMVEELSQQHILRRRSMADIAHELRTPLSVLQIDLESIEDGLSQPNAEMIGALKSEVLHLHRLVEDLRMLSLAESGDLKLDMQPIEMVDVVRRVVGRVSETTRQAGIDLAIHVPDEPCWVEGDSQRLAQVLFNLLLNAVQHTSDGGQIDIDLKQVNDERILIVVRDNGEGISVEDLKYIFERLYRSDRSRTRDTGGSGLGLSIAKSLIEAHAGRIWVESVEGKGSDFYIELPLQQSDKNITE